MALVSIGKFAKLIGFTPATLRHMHETGELLPCYISKGGTRYYSEQQLTQLINPTSNTNKLIGYTVVPTEHLPQELLEYVDMYKLDLLVDPISDKTTHSLTNTLKRLISLITANQLQTLILFYDNRYSYSVFINDMILYLAKLHSIHTLTIDLQNRSELSNLGHV